MISYVIIIIAYFFLYFYLSFSLFALAGYFFTSLFRYALTNDVYVYWYCHVIKIYTHESIIDHQIPKLINFNSELLKYKVS